MHWEPLRQPQESEWDKLKALQKEHPSDYMIWEAQPLESVAEKLRELGLEVIVFDPCANKPANGDYLSIMSANVDNFNIRR